ncbi:MAG: ABC transporter ATP-binding protein [Candidatus Woesearchaeota archaeon]
MGKSNKQFFKVENLSKVYGKRYIFNNINFNINEGEIFGIIGVSGSGKSTLLNILVGFVKPEKGKILYKSENLKKSKDGENSYKKVYNNNEFKTLYGFAAQTPSFYSKLTVLENLRYFGTLYNIPNKIIEGNIKNLLDMVGLTQSQHTISKQLSGGMKRRLDIACALIHNPKILFLDEPTADLDPVLSNKIWNLLRIINQRGTTIILASHNLLELEQVCSRIAIIKEGKIAAIGSPEEIKKKQFSQEIIYLKSVPGKYKNIINKLRGKNQKEIKKIEIQGQSLLIHTTNHKKIISEIFNIFRELKEEVTDIEVIKPKLDNVFIEINENENIRKIEKKKEILEEKEDNIKKKKTKIKKKKIEKVKEQKEKLEKVRPEKRKRKRLKKKKIKNKQTLLTKEQIEEIEKRVQESMDKK